MGIFVPVVDQETPRSERGPTQTAAEAKHRSFDAPHVLRREAAAKGTDRDERAQEAVNAAVNAAPRRFLPSAVWRGVRPGYMFGRGEQGQGYYADASQGERWRESSRQGARRRSRSPGRRSRSRSRERQRPILEKPTPASFDASKLEKSISHKKPVEAELTEEQRRAAALARLAERRQAGAGAKPGGHGGGVRW